MLKKIIFIILLIFININLTFWYYQENINDNIKIYNIYKKIQNFTKNNNITWKKLDIFRNLMKEKLQAKINKKKQFNSFKEYAYFKIYNFFDYWDVFSNFNNQIYYNILKNHYFKILVTNKNIKINENYLYDIKWNQYINIIKIPKNQNLQNYFEKNIIIKNCKIINNPKNFIRNIKYNFFILKSINSKNICETKLDNYWIRYFIKIDKQTIMYINEWEDYNWIDFETIKLLNN